MNSKKIMVYWPKIRRGGLEKSFFRYLENESKFSQIYIICDNESSKYNKILQKNNINFIYTKNNRLLRILYTLYILLNIKYDFLFALQKDSLKVCLFVRLVKNIKLLYFDRTNQLYYENKFQKYWMRFIYFLLIKFSDKIFVNSEHLYRYLRLNLKSNKIYRIFNPTINNDLKKYYKNKVTKNSLIKIIIAGRNVKQKNFKYIFENLSFIEKNFNNFEIDIFTDNLSNKINHPKIKFFEFDENIISNLNKYDIMIFPSLFEGFPNFLLEASYLGLTVIHSNFKFGACEFNKLENCHMFNLKNTHTFERAIINSKKTCYKSFDYVTNTNYFFNNFDQTVSCEDFRKKIYA